MLLVALAASARAEVIERVVAVVDEDVVLLSELRRRSMPFLEQTMYGAETPKEKTERVKELYERLIQQLVDEQLIQKAARQAHVTVGKLEVEQAVERVRKQNAMTEEQFWETVRAQGFTEKQYREDVRKQLLRLKVTNQRVRSRVSIPEEDVRERYDDKLRQARRALRFRAAHIFFELPPSASATEVNQARRRAEALRRGLTAENFDEVLSRQQGGDLGWLSQGDLPESLERTLMGLGPGELSEPVRGPSGMHIFLLRERQRGNDAITLPSYESVRERLQQQMMEEAMMRQQQIYLQQLRRRSVIEVRL
jgi:peptidyl-prolyl cis-trans isomerase SurA